MGMQVETAAAAEKREADPRRPRAALLASTCIASALFWMVQGTSPAEAAVPDFINVCSGLGAQLPALAPVANTTSGLLTGLLAPVSTALNGTIDNVNTNVVNVLNGAQIDIGVIDPTSGQIITPTSNQCNVSANTVQVTDSSGLSFGGGLIGGLGGTGSTHAIAGDLTAIAIGNGSLTMTGAANALAVGTGAITNAANSVALGANALAARGALPAYSAFGVTGNQLSLGEVSIGAAGAERQLTNLAAGSQPTDAVNLAQLTGAASNLASSIGTNLGGSVVYNPATGQLTAPTYTVQGQVYHSVGDALAAIQTSTSTVLPYLHVSSTLTDVTTVGSNASALGPHANAPGAAASALGLRASALGDDTVAIGTDSAAGATGANVAIGKSASANAGTASGAAVSIGSGNVAVGNGAIAIGDPNTATGTGAIAEGADNSVYGDGGVGIGNLNTVNSASTPAAGTVALGESNTAVGQGSVALGYFSSATGAGSLAFGDTASATHAGGVALGSGATDGANNNVNGTVALATSGPVTLSYSNSSNTVVGSVSVGASGATRQIQNVADGSDAHDAATVGQVAGVASATNAALVPLQAASKLAVQYNADSSGNPTTAINLATGNANLPLNTTQVSLTGVAPGQLTSHSTDAVNGAQLYATNQSIQNLQLGQAGPFVSDSSVTATQPVASGANASAGGFGAVASGAASTVVGNQATDNGIANSTVLGTQASVSSGLTGSNVALGQNSVANRGAQSNYSAFGISGLRSSIGEVAVGTSSGQRQLTGLAAGTQDSDAVNVAQLRGTASNLGTSIATTIGGSSTYDTSTGQVIGSTFSVNGTTYNTITSAISALSAGGAGPVVYSSSAAPTTPNGNVASNDVTLVGANTSIPVGLHNVAAGSAGATSTDAINGSQLAAAETSIATIFGGGATYNSSTGTLVAPTYTIAGHNYNSVGDALAALSNSSGGAASPYFQANSTAAAASATGANAVAAGPTTHAAGAASVALGSGASATGTNSVALGAGSTDGGMSNVVSVGSVGAERRIVNVAAGTLSSSSTDAVNGSQLYATNQTIAAVGHSAVQYTTTATGQTESEINLSTDQGGPVIIHNLAAGVASSDAATVGQLASATTNSVQYTTYNGIRTNNLTLIGGSTGPVTISNVGPGVAGTDAVNLNQLASYSQGALTQANAYTDQRVNNLAALTQKEISQARQDAAAGSAAALAATGLRYDDRPGKTAIAGATAYYHGQAGLAFGIGHMSEDGQFRVNAAFTLSPTTSNPEVGGVVGASMSFN